MTGKMRVRNPDGGWIEIDGGAKIPTKLSELTSDAAHRTVTDSEKAAWNGKLDADELPEAVDDALAQAKASGEFDGKTPVKGTDYWTPADQEAIVRQVIAALPDASEVMY